jgi:hypothetical protein
VTSVASPIVFSIEGKLPSGTIGIDSAGNAVSAIMWTIVDASQNIPAPLLVGSVSSNTSGTERIERVTIPSGCASITSQSGAWVSSVASGGTGICNITIAAGMFSSAPTCTCSTVAQRECRLNATPTTTSVVAVSFDTSAAINSEVDVLCMGPK